MKYIIMAAAILVSSVALANGPDAALLLEQQTVTSESVRPNPNDRETKGAAGIECVRTEGYEDRVKELEGVIDCEGELVVDDPAPDVVEEDYPAKD